MLTVQCYNCSNEVLVTEGQTEGVCPKCRVEFVLETTECLYPVIINGEIATCEDISQVVEYLETKEGVSLQYNVSNNEAEVYDPETGIVVANLKLDSQWDLYSNIQITIQTKTESEVEEEELVCA